MRKLMPVIMVVTMAVGGCANTSKGQQAAMAAALGGLAGAGLGAAIGGKHGAIIGAATGAALAGIATYGFASDPYTQSATQQADAWKKQTGVGPAPVKVSEVIESGKTKQQIDVQKMALSNTQFVTNNRLSPLIKQQLTAAKSESTGTGGIVHVLYPPNTPPDVLQDLRSTGVSIERDNTLNDGYVILLARSQNDLDLFRG